MRKTLCTLSLVALALLALAPAAVAQSFYPWADANICDWTRTNGASGTTLVFLHFGAANGSGDRAGSVDTWTSPTSSFQKLARLDSGDAAPGYDWKYVRSPNPHPTGNGDLYCDVDVNGSHGWFDFESCTNTVSQECTRLSYIASLGEAYECDCADTVDGTFDQAACLRDCAVDCGATWPNPTYRDVYTGLWVEAAFYDETCPVTHTWP